MTKRICFRTLRRTLPITGLTVLVLAMGRLHAQQQEPAIAVPAESLTLERVLELAEAKSEPVVIAHAGIARADAEGIRARSGLLPQLTASASYDRALASEFENIFTSTAPTCAPFTLNQTASIDARIGELERAVDCGATGSNGRPSGPRHPRRLPGVASYNNAVPTPIRLLSNEIPVGLPLVSRRISKIEKGRRSRGSTPADGLIMTN